MAESGIREIGVDLIKDSIEVTPSYPHSDSWSLGCDITIESTDAEVQEIRTADIILTGNISAKELSVDVESKNNNVIDLGVNAVINGISSALTESQIVPYENILKITTLSPESANETRYASSALSAKIIYDLISSVSRRVGVLEQAGEQDGNEQGGVIDEDILNRLDTLEKNQFFERYDDQTIKTKYNLFSDHEISAHGLNIGSGSGNSGEGGGAAFLKDLWDVTIVNAVNDDILIYNGTHWVNRPQSSIVPDLSVLNNYLLKTEAEELYLIKDAAKNFATADSVSTVSNRVTSLDNALTQLSTNYGNRLDNIEKIIRWFHLTDDEQAIYTEKNFYSEKEISAHGLNYGNGGSEEGGAIEIGNIIGVSLHSPVTGDVFVFNGTHWTNVPQSTLVPEIDLTRYATADSVSTLDSKIKQIEQQLAELGKDQFFFRLEGTKDVIYTPYNLYSEKEVSAHGLNYGSGEGASGFLKDLLDVKADDSSTGDLLVYDGSHWVSRPQSSIVPDIDTSIVATREWVEGKGYATGTDLQLATTAMKVYVDEQDGKLEDKIAKVLDWFTLDGDVLLTKYNLASEKEVSAHGINTGGNNGGGGLISSVYGTDKFGSIASSNNTETFNAYAIDSLYKRIVELEGKEVEIDLSDYYTKGQTDSRINQAIAGINLTPYATKEDLSDAIGGIDFSPYATKTEIDSKLSTVATQISGLGTRLDTAEVNITSLGNRVGVAESAIKTNADAIAINKSDIEKILDWFTLQDGVLLTKYNLASKGEVSALGINASQSGGSAYSRLDSWSAYDSSKAGYVLSALLGYDLHTRLIAVENKTVDLSGYYTKSQTDSKINSAISAIDFSPYATKNELSSAISGLNISQYATTSALNKAIADLNISQYAKTTDVASTYATIVALNSLSASHNTLRNEFDALNSLLNDDTSGVIDTWNEVVDFINEYSGSQDLATILAGMQNDINSRHKTSDFNAWVTNTFTPLSNRVGVAESTISNHGGRITTAESNIASLQTLTTTHTTQISGLTTRMGSAETNISNNATAIANNKANIDKLLGWFKIDSDGNIYTEYNFYSTKQISALGLNAGSGGGISYSRLDAWSSYDSDKAGYVLSALLGYDLHTRVTTLENKTVDLSGYYTKSQTDSRINSAIGAIDFSPYAKSTDIANTYATKSALNSLSVAIDELNGYDLDNRVSTIENSYVSKDASGVINGGLIANSFKVSGGLSSQFLKADGSLDSNSYLTSVSWSQVGSRPTALSQFTNDLGLGSLAYKSSLVASDIPDLSNKYLVTSLLGDYTLIHSGNIGSQNVNYATSAGNADTVDNVHLEWSGSQAASSTEWLAGWTSDGMKLKAVKRSDLSVASADTLDGYHASAFAQVRKPNDFIFASNEFTFVPSSYSGIVYINYRTASEQLDGNIKMYKFCNGAGGDLASITNGAFSGNSATATKLATARTFWGQSFDGTGNVDGAMIVNGTGYFSDAVTLGSTLSAGATTLASLTVTDGIAANGGIVTTTITAATITANTSATIAALTVNGNATIGGSLAAGATTLSSLTVSGATEIRSDLRLKKTSSNYGCYLRFGDGSYCYLYEDSDDHLKIFADKGVTIASATTISSTLTVSGNLTASSINGYTPITSGNIGSQSVNYATTAGSASANDVYAWAKKSALAASDVPSLDWSKITTGKPTTLSGYGITDAYTKTDVYTKSDVYTKTEVDTIAAKYLLLTGGTVTGATTFSGGIVVNDISGGGNTLYLGNANNYAYIMVREDMKGSTNMWSIPRDGKANFTSLKSSSTLEVATDAVINGTLSVAGLVTTKTIKIKSGQALQFEDSNGAVHELKYDSSKQAFVFTGNVNATGEMSARTINA